MTDCLNYQNPNEAQAGLFRPSLSQDQLVLGGFTGSKLIVLGVPAFYMSLSVSPKMSWNRLRDMTVKAMIAHLLVPTHLVWIRVLLQCDLF